MLRSASSSMMTDSTFPEQKFSDIDTATYQVNTTGSFTLLHVPVLGTDYTNRIGRKTSALSVHVQGRIQTEASAGNIPVTVAAQEARMILFVDFQPNGAAPAVTDLLLSATPASFLNPNNRDRFSVLADERFFFDPMFTSNVVTQSYASSVNQIFGVDCEGSIRLETVFNGVNGGTIGDITSGALYMFWIGSTAAGVNLDANAIVASRVLFYDS